MVKDVYCTVGHYDVVMIMEGSDEAVTTALLKVGSLGNVRMETLPGFSLEDMKNIIGKILLVFIGIALYEAAAPYLNSSFTHRCTQTSIERLS